MRTKLIVAALAAAGLESLAMPAFAAKPDPALLEKLAARLEKLEARNTELEKEVKTLKTDNEKIAKG
ncbi:MAG: high affinity Mn2+ porin, partial [Pseudomonadota bacterium]|nr:high affinity Mn2+ porin [Pseudomonadota bacterium]